jgi:hypothetical protein
MKKKERGLPLVVFLGPPQARIEHRLVVFKILSRDENNIPRECVMLKDNETVNIQEGDEFMTAYVQRQMTEPRP